MTTSKVEEFLSAAEEQSIIQAIRESERQTSGEIRVHLEHTSPTHPYERAQQLFHELKMDNTKEENGVLFYVAVQDHKFAICGDRGIDLVVPDNFWESTKDLVLSHFKLGNHATGLIAGIQLAGKELATYFPWETGDKNELPDEISTS